jgi:hypothetical protein
MKFTLTIPNWDSSDSPSAECTRDPSTQTVTCDILVLPHKEQFDELGQWSILLPPGFDDDTPFSY